jgi:hypothetical protein
MLLQEKMKPTKASQAKIFRNFLLGLRPPLLAIDGKALDSI